MEYTYKKAKRMLEVERGDLNQERMVIDSNISRNVRKIDSTLKRMEGIRDEKKKQARDVRTVAKRLTYEKDCVERQLLFEKEVCPSCTFSSHLYLILFFLRCIKALQRKANKYNEEKKESNTKRRKVDERLRATEIKNKRLQKQLVEAQQVVESPQKRVPLVRNVNRNLGITAEFEAHVRNLMATGGSARQVRDNLVLNADHFLCESESIPYKKDIPTERWFSLQRKALGVQSQYHSLSQPHTVSLFWS
jgi:hypothetical protein